MTPDPSPPGLCLWLTGRPASGKTTLARLLIELLSPHHARPITLLDGDQVRALGGADLGFSLSDRALHAQRVAAHARASCEQGHLVICALISPTPVIRAAARHILSPLPFLECFVCCPLATCEARDPKGLYALARRGELEDFTGISSPYVDPESPEITIHTDSCPPHAAATRLAELIASHLPP